MDDWQDIEDDAWDAARIGDIQRAGDLARSVLKQEPNAIDSYVILSKAVETHAEKLALLQEGTRIGKERFAAELQAAPREEFSFWAEHRHKTLHARVSRPFIGLRRRQKGRNNGASR